MLSEGVNSMSERMQSGTLCARLQVRSLGRPSHIDLDPQHAAHAELESAARTSPARRRYTLYSLMLPLTLISLIGPLVDWLAPSHAPTIPTAQKEKSPELRFQLRHLHGLTNNSRVVFSDVPTSPKYLSVYGSVTEELSRPAKTRRLNVSRPTSREAYVRARDRSRLYGEKAELNTLQWDEDEVVGPDVTNRETLLLLAKMTSNSYYNTPGQAGWYELNEGWNVVRPSVLPAICLC